MERSVGAAVALRSFKALLGGDDKPEIVRAAAGAFRCALALGDDLELAAVCAYWETKRTLDAGGTIDELVVPLLVAGRTGEAVMIATAEMKRCSTGVSAYRQARALEAAGRPSEDTFAQAAELGDDALRCVARCQQLAAMRSRSASPQAQLGVAEGIDLAFANDAQKWLVASVRLGATSRFARAAALSLLEELAGGGGALAVPAMRAAAAHADVTDELTWVEADRVAAALANWPDAGERAAALARLEARRHIAAAPDADAAVGEAAGLDAEHHAYLERARATLAGYRFATETPPAARELRRADICLRAIDELRSASWRAAELSVRELFGELDDAGDEAPRALWVVARLAMNAPNAQHVALAGLELTARLLEVVPFPPLVGYLAFAGAAHRHRAPQLTEALLRHALRRNEPGARELLAQELAQRAQQTTDKRAALALLREAKTLTTT